MAVGRFFQGLTAFDLLGNVIPGSVALLAALGFAANPILPSTLGGAVLFAGGGFILGAVIQAHASSATAKPRSFNWTIRYAEQLDDLLKSSSSEEGTDSQKIGLPQGYALYGWEYARPAYFSVWAPSWVIPLLALVGTWTFWSLYQSAEEDYIEYLFADYAVSIVDSDPTIQFSDDGLSLTLEDADRLIEVLQAERDEDEEDTTD